MLALPFRGTWRVRNSPARRVPSHGTHLFATTYAMDFIAVRDRRTAPVRDWRTLVASEPSDRFYAFGLPILAPAAGQVVAVHDGEADHEARRSPFALLSYAVTQAARVRGGAAAIAGNHVILSVAGGYVVLAHLRAGSVGVRVGEQVTVGQQVGECGNSGNSTQPHLHIQAMDGLDPFTARGLPMSFAYRVSGRIARGVPGESQIVEP